MWFDYFEFGFALKKWRGYPEHIHRKPYDCFTCTNFWIGLFYSIIYSVIFICLFGFNWTDCLSVLIFIGLNYIVGNIIDHIKYE